MVVIDSALVASQTEQSEDSRIRVKRPANSRTGSKIAF
jgi:hypothetical protein